MAPAVEAICTAIGMATGHLTDNKTKGFSLVLEL